MATIRNGRIHACRTPAESIAASSRASMDDMVEQVYAVLESRGAPRRTLRPSWILVWLQKGMSPQEIVNLAIGEPRWAHDAHLGGRRA